MTNISPLNELDETIVDEVDKLLEDTDKMPLKTGVSLNLAMTSRSYRAINQLIVHVKETNGQVGDLQKRVKELEKKNLINWVGNNTKTAMLIFLSFIFVTDIIVDRISTADSFNTLMIIVRKYLGL